MMNGMIVGEIIATIGMFGLLCWIFFQTRVVDVLAFKKYPNEVTVPKTSGELIHLKARGAASGIFGFSMLLLILSLIIMLGSLVVAMVRGV